MIAEVDLTFAHPITGESVIGYLEAAAAELGDIPFDEDDVELKAEGVESIRDRATQWNVKMGVYKESDAFRVFERVQQTMAEEPYFASSSGVGGQVAGQTQQKALFAMMASLVGIIGYIWIRFQNVAFGLAAIVALVHDVLVVLGAIAVSYWLSKVFGFLLIEDFRISLSVVAALLTIIGYSLNDTIVVFDRIREVRGKRTDITAEMINRSISQTLSRTILTSLTTLLVVVILYVLGGESIHAFAFALVIGVIVGTYSSIFVASPTLLWLMNRGVAPPPVTPEKPQAT
ncbi:MAG: protein translocase subunit SecF [Pirellulaceae bacterium]